MLEALLERHPSAHYAMTGRYLTGSGYNFLCLKNWRQLALPAPLAFVPEEERAHTVGHYGAFWFNLGEGVVAEQRLTTFIKSVNRHFNLKGGAVRNPVRRTILKLIDARVNNEYSTARASHKDN
ncbi:MAG: hypothetical protein A2Y63_03840 [Candidatus Riflebacteria bacterium RBG_13_59_9]|nr:MAG: hypothetical protein A2Y63_03840 [Candidatus Riflebacteria bacterium RBG_13_59_9]